MRLSTWTWPLLVLLAGYYVYRTVVLPLPHLGPQASDFSWYHEAARAILSGSSPFSVEGFVYPPLFAFLITPLAPLSYEAARWVWFWINHLFLLAAAFLLWRTLGGARLALVSVACVWALGGAVTENLTLGQINPLLLLLLVVSWRYHGSRAGPAAVAVAAAAKIWPATLLGAYLLARRWRALFLAVCLLGLLVLLPGMAIRFLLAPPHVPGQTAYWAGTPALFNFSVPAVTLRLLDPPEAGEPLPHNWVFGNNVRELRLTAADAAASVAVSLGLLTAGFLWLFRFSGSRIPPAEEPLVSGALAALALAASPVAWSHYQLVQYAGVAALLVRFLEKRRLGSTIFLAVIFAGLYRIPIAGLGPYLAQYGWTAGNPWVLWFLTSLTPLSALALFTMYAAELRRARSDT